MSAAFQMRDFTEQREEKRTDRMVSVEEIASVSIFVGAQWNPPTFITNMKDGTRLHGYQSWEEIKRIVDELIKQKNL